MKSGKIVSIIGGIVLGFGILFHLQGLAVVGPQSSFMYANSEWTGNGIIITISGAIILGIGIWWFFRKI